MSEFDEYARNYDRILDHIGRRIVDRRGNYFLEVKCRELMDLLGTDKTPNNGWRIIDVGCGIGGAERFMPPGFARITAFDLSYGMINVARHVYAPSQANYLQADAARAPLPTAFADLVFSSCVFHHMKEEKIVPVLQEMRRMCKPGGWVVCFEHNPYHPLTQLVVHTTPIDRHARLHTLKKMNAYFSSAGLSTQKQHYFLHAPKVIDQYFRAMLPVIGHLPFGGQYILAGQPI